uniref:Nose resistant-to-fluoxetine protein N-terminal domain-containing protein n=1 Tax=Phlebotomus papatasi TaxID=29031 RepID=A0A1B0GN68_PHLPP
MLFARVVLLLSSVVVVISASIPAILRENLTVSDIAEFRENLIHSSILYGILNATLENSMGGSVCERELEMLFEGVNTEELWALKVIDASASVPEAFIWGSNFWLGSRQECNSVSNSIELTLTDAPETDALVYAKAPYPMDYRVVYLNISTVLQVDAKFTVKPILHLGLCMPQSCSNSEVIEAFERYTYKALVSAFATYRVHPNVTGIKKPSLTWSLLLRPELIAFIVFCGTIVALMLIQGLSSFTQSDCNGNEKKSSVGIFLDCFAFRCNMSYIFRTSTPNSISAIAGIRSIVCLWIVAFHVLYYGLHYSESASLFLANSQGLLYQVFWAAVIYVDVFFALSAFLLVYNILGNIELQHEIQGNGFGKNVVLFGKHVLHRYIRLTPALLATVLQTEFSFHSVITKY